MISGWAATAVFTYLDTRQMIDDLTDAHLKQSADMLLRLLDRMPAAEVRQPDGLILQTAPGQEFSFRIWPGDQRPAEDIGFRDTVRGGEAGRTFGAAGANGQEGEV